MLLIGTWCRKVWNGCLSRCLEQVKLWRLRCDYLKTNKLSQRASDNWEDGENRLLSEIRLEAGEGFDVYQE